MVFLDLVIMTIIENELAVLCIKRNRQDEPFFDMWSLAGGHIPDNLNLEEAVKYQLKRELNLNNLYFKQLQTFGDVGRDPRGRAFSIAYLAIIPQNQIQLKTTSEARDVQWFKLSEIPLLAFDHNKIVETAKERVINQIRYTPIGFQLIGDEFSMTDLVKTFSNIIGEEIDQSNLRTKLLKLGIIKETNNVVNKKGKGRPSPVFKINKKALSSISETEVFFGKQKDRK